jgi:flagellar motor switch protein FliN/FliY
MTALEEIAHLADVPIDVEIELARKTMALRDILALSVGSVVKMPRSAGENIDILAGGTLIASGEVVIIEETVGIRITDFKDAD